MSNLRNKFVRSFSKIFEKSKPPHQREAKDVKMVDPMSIAFPLYIYPSSGAWSPLFDAISNNPSTSFNIVVNPNNGPGGSVPDSNYVQYISQLNSHDNVNLFGYVHTSWGGRDLADVQSDISTYEMWARYGKADIHVDGVFLDEAPSDTKFVEYMGNISKYTKSVLANEALVWTNPGVTVDPSFYEVADLVNAYENSWQYWSEQGGNKAIPAALRAKSTVMIHSYTGSDSTMADDTDALVDAGYNSSLLTTDQSYTTFCPLWSSYVDYVATSGADPIDPCN